MTFENWYPYKTVQHYGNNRMLALAAWTASQSASSAKIQALEKSRDEAFERLCAAEEDRDVRVYELKAEVERLKEELKEWESSAVEDSKPQWTCVECGNMDKFKDIVHETMDGSEYDIECCDCQSRYVAESPSEAVHQIALKLEGVTLKSEDLEKHNTLLVDALKNAEEFLGRVVSWQAIGPISLADLTQKVREALEAVRGGREG